MLIAVQIHDDASGVDAVLTNPLSGEFNASSFGMLFRHRKSHFVKNEKAAFNIRLNAAYKSLGFSHAKRECIGSVLPSV